MSAAGISGYSCATVKEIGMTKRDMAIKRKAARKRPVAVTEVPVPVVRELHSAVREAETLLQWCKRKLKEFAQS
jgi:hypothetical protein